MENTHTEKTTSLFEAADIFYLTPECAAFYKNGDFCGAKIKTDGEEKIYDRVFFHRAFPFDLPSFYVSVQDEEEEEIGLIKDLSVFDDETVELINFELSRKYYTPKITKILSLKETRGFSYWKVASDAGEINFTLQDTYRSISRIGEDRAFITDVSGNRYEIESMEALDSKSRRKLEIYL